MRKYNILNFFLLILIISSSKCKVTEQRYPLYIVNNTNQNLYVFFNEDAHYKSIYPDTQITNFKDRLGLPIKSFRKELIVDGSATWQSVYEVNVPNDTLSFFIFNTDTLFKYPWDTIRSKYMILQRYDLSLKDLQNRNFELEYPYDSTRGKLKVYIR